MVSEQEEWLCAGSITGAYGIRGWVRVHAFTDRPEDFLALHDWHLAAPQSAEAKQPVAVLEGRRQGRGLIVRLAGVDDRTAAERMRGQEFWVPAAQLPALEEGEYYWRDLMGLRVYAEVSGSEGAEGTAAAQQRELLLGEVDHLLETGANDVLVLRPCEGSIDRRERLVPYLPGDVVLAVDPEPAPGRITVRWHPDD